MAWQREAAAGVAERLFEGGGEMGALMRTLDWGRTPLGPVEGWPQSLKTALGILLLTRHPAFIWWGRDLVQFYNDGYRPILGQTKHPAAMGSGGRETWKEIWHVIEPMIATVFAGGSTYERDGLLVLDRNGFLEECYFDYAYSPIRDEDGAVGGVFVACSETTGRVVGERRLETLGSIAAGGSGAETIEAAARAAVAVMARAAADVPCAAIYLPDGEGQAVLAASHGFPEGSAWAPARVPLSPPVELGPWPIARVLREGVRAFVEAPAGGGEPLPGGPWPEPAKAAEVLPLSHGGRVFGVLVAGLSPRLPYGEQYRNFVELLAEHVARALSGAVALDEERRRAAALAELDRAKTAFFSNVSHELRTPLTLVLAPVEEALGSPEQALSGAALEALHRNQLRLLKLVDGLLDFARIEGGRVRASYEPTDLSALTADLVSGFRAAFERAGVRLLTDLPPLPVVQVDRDMWETIVLNLLSNALKFTFEGEVRISLRESAGGLALEVRDTGVGIPPAELPRVFERFHRVEGTRSRTHEGTGIGLALVAELSKLLGGSARAESEPGVGSTFTVEIPRGAGRADDRPSAASRGAARGSARGEAFLAEALRWGPDRPEARASEPHGEPLVLVADDNADLRDYLRRLLGARFRVDTAADGAAALARAREEVPDVVVADVMMPVLDGFGLLRELRADPRTHEVRVVMLSARAGEEARVEGLSAGADDYVVKPFGARELVARVTTQAELARARRRVEEQRSELYQLFMQAPVPICVVRGEELVFEMANPLYEQVVGRGDLAGRPLLEALPEIHGQGLDETLREVLRSGRPFVAHERPVPIARRGEPPVPVHFSFIYAPLKGAGGRIDRVMVLANDVSDQVRARGSAEAASRAKDEFLAVLGHELRNPLAPMATALQLMRLRAPDVLVQERAVVERQVSHMERLVDDLLDVSRITRGKVELRRRRVELGDVVARALEVASPLLEERSHAVEVEVERGLVVEGDGDRLVQVFSNLLTNAAKYMDPHGLVRIRGTASGAEAVIVVEDHGRGMHPGLVPRVFDLFVQGERHLVGARGGLGIGLAIVKNLVTMHGGAVAARSRGPGQGSAFEVRLPLAIAGRRERPPAPQPPPPTLRPRRVLVVDDNGDAAQALAELLEAQGHHARVAFDGPSALAVAAQFRPDVVLLDIGMPVMDGYELATRLREAGHQAAMVAVTGYGQVSDLARSRDAGFALHLVKPIDPQRLRTILAEVQEPASLEAS